MASLGLGGRHRSVGGSGCMCDMCADCIGILYDLDYILCWPHLTFINGSRALYIL